MYKYDRGFEKHLLSLKEQSFFSKNNKFEIIIVFDSPKLSNKKILNKISKYELPNLKIAQSKGNFGRCVSRNAGLFLSKNQIVLFANSNLILDPDSIYENMLRHEHLDNVMLIGMKRRIDCNSPEISDYLIRSKKVKIKPTGT